jgi:hypothetical protein
MGIAQAGFYACIIPRKMLDKHITFVVRLFMVKKLTAIRIGEQDLRKLEELAVREDETVSSLVRQAIKEFLNRRAK